MLSIDQISELLKKAIQQGAFEITQPVKLFPASASLKSLIETENSEKEQPI